MNINIEEAVMAENQNDPASNRIFTPDAKLNIA
jgi:hypothetical protein